MPKSSETRTLLFTSCKGGVGKSTVCANLAMAMAAMGQKILLIDCDFGNRCLDIIMGLSDDAVYDIGDAVLGRVSPEDAIVKDGRSDGIHFIAAPYNYSSRMGKTVGRLNNSTSISSSCLQERFTAGSAAQPRSLQRRGLIHPPCTGVNFFDVSTEKRHDDKTFCLFGFGKFALGRATNRRRD